MCAQSHRVLTDSPAPPDWTPLDPAEHDRQVAGLKRLLGKSPKRVLDVGCGDGRAARPLIKAGHRVVGIDSDPRAVWACAAADFTCVLGDFLDEDGAVWRAARRHGPFDAVVCLGHTFLLIPEPARAAGLLGRARGVLKKGAGVFVVDDFAGLWREIAEGNWQEGLSPDGAQQLVWGEGDNVVAHRQGPAVRRASWKITRADKPMRLWSRGELELLGMATGWAFEARARDGVGVFRR